MLRRPMLTGAESRTTQPAFMYTRSPSTRFLPYATWKGASMKTPSPIEANSAASSGAQVPRRAGSIVA